MLDGSQSECPLTRDVVETCELMSSRLTKKQSENIGEVITKSNEVVALCLTRVGVWRNNVRPFFLSFCPPSYEWHWELKNQLPNVNYGCCLFNLCCLVWWFLWCHLSCLLCSECGVQNVEFTLMILITRRIWVSELVNFICLRCIFIFCKWKIKNNHNNSGLNYCRIVLITVEWLVWKWHFFQCHGHEPQVNSSHDHGRCRCTRRAYDYWLVLCVQTEDWWDQVCCVHVRVDCVSHADNHLYQ